MLAEKFFLLLETILSNCHADGSPRIRSKVPFVPMVKTPLLRDVSGRSQETYLEEAKPARGPDTITD
jgi:hypothetical protein